MVYTDQISGQKMKHVGEYAVRLSDKEIEVIRSVIMASDKSAGIFLFGSCTDITKVL
jgi:hypothetical protein